MGSGLVKPIRIGGVAAATLFYNPGYVVVQVPASLPPGAAFVESGLGKPISLLVERSAPGIVTVAEGAVLVTGIDPALPVWVEVGEFEVGVVEAKPVGAGVFRLEFSTPFAGLGLKPIVVRQAGRSSQRGVFVM
jgi:hypothetical protein